MHMVYTAYNDIISIMSRLGALHQHSEALIFPRDEETVLGFRDEIQGDCFLTSKMCWEDGRWLGDAVQA